MQEEQRRSISIFIPILKIITAVAVAFLTLSGLLSLIYRPENLQLVFFDPTITPTYITNTPAPTNTPQPTKSPTNTATPLPTQTPFPASAYAVADLSSIRPALDRNGVSAVILNEDIATVDPPLEHFQWISSATISQDIGYEISEPYYATFGPGSITWYTDMPMKPALYELFVMDTLFSSGGELDFTVRLNDQIIEPIVGMSFVEYQSSQGEPPQYNDVWQSIGIYDINQIGIISVSTEWGYRDERSIVAVDRVLILEHSEKSRTIITTLPEANGTIYIADDTDAAFSSTQYWDYWEDPSAWGGQYQVLTDPPLASSVTWTIPATLTYGDYEIYAWIPKVNGIAPVTYRLYASGLQMPESTGQNEVLLEEGQGHNNEAQWLHLGSWNIPEHFGNYIRFTLNLSVEENAIGDVVVDAIALIKK